METVWVKGRCALEVRSSVDDMSRVTLAPRPAGSV